MLLRGLFNQSNEIEFFRFSNLLSFVSLGALAMSIILFLIFGLNYGIDFRGGTMFMVSSSEKIKVSDIVNSIDEELDKNLKKTFENKEIMNPKERNKYYGQYDHVRVYGLDFYTRLAKSGFTPKKIDILKEMSNEEKIKYCLPKDEKIPIGIAIK